MQAEHLALAVERLQAAFPDGLVGDEYLALLDELTKEMSLRAACSAVTIAFGLDDSLVMNDIYRVRSKAGVALERDIIASVQARLAGARVLAE